MELTGKKRDQVEVIKAALTSADYLHGGELNEKQQDSFDRIIRGTSDLLQTVQMDYVDQSKGKIDKLYIGGIVSEKATEATDSGNTFKPVFGKLEYACKKIRTAFDVSHEWMVDNVEQESFKQTIVETMAERFGHDLSLLCVNGDSAGVHPLYSAIDGFYKESDATNLLDARGAEISRSIFSAAFKRMPAEERRNKRNFKWMMNSSLEVDWVDYLSGRATGLGDSAVAGSMANPHGVPIQTIDEISDSLSVAYTAGAIRGIHTGTVADPFVLASTNNVMRVLVTVAGAAGADTTITVPAGVYEAIALAAYLNAAMVTAGEPEVFTTDGHGHLRVLTVNTGATDSVQIIANANSMYTTVGMTAAVYAGAAAGANTLNQGTYMWLADPKNFHVVILKGIRSSYEYVPRKDIWEWTMYNEVDIFIRRPSAVVRVDNIKIKD